MARFLSWIFWHLIMRFFSLRFAFALARVKTTSFYSMRDLTLGIDIVLSLGIRLLTIRGLTNLIFITMSVLICIPGWANASSRNVTIIQSAPLCAEHHCANGKVVGSIPKGAVVKIEDIEGIGYENYSEDWYLVTYENKRGWINENVTDRSMVIGDTRKHYKPKFTLNHVINGNTIVINTPHCVSVDRSNICQDVIRDQSWYYDQGQCVHIPALCHGSSFVTKEECVSACIDQPQTGTETVRLIGIELPESFDNEETRHDSSVKGSDIDAITAMEQEAAEFVKGVVRSGEEVLIETDIEKRDKDGRLLAYVYINCRGKNAHKGPMVRSRPDFYCDNYEDHSCTFLNASIIRSGYAKPIHISPNVKQEELLNWLYQDARVYKRGFWKDILQKNIIIPLGHRKCANDRECMMVGPGCKAGCECPIIPVNQEYGYYHKNLFEKCRENNGLAACDAECPSIKSTCVAGVCSY